MDILRLSHVDAVQTNTQALAVCKLNMYYISITIVINKQNMIRLHKWDSSLRDITAHTT